MYWAELHEMTGLLVYKPGWRFRLVTDYTFAFDTIVEHDGDNGHAETSPVGQVIGHSDAESPPILLISAMLPDSRNPGNYAEDKPGDWVDSQHVFWTDAKDRDQGHAYWRRWLLLCCCLVELHEAMEYFEIAGFKTFYPAHGPGTPIYEIKDKTPA